MLSSLNVATLEELSVCVTPTKVSKKLMQQTIKSLSGCLLILPNPEENAQINAGIAADSDTYELSDDDIARLKPYRQSVTLSLPFDVIDAFQETGAGWQNLMATALQQWLQEHPNRI